MGRRLKEDELAQELVFNYNHQELAESVAWILTKMSKGQLVNFCFYCCGGGLDEVLACEGDSCVMFWHRHDRVEE